MKLEPIRNPHAQVGSGVQKKTKQEEKDELIEKTKKTTLDKYGVWYLIIIIKHFTKNSFSLYNRQYRKQLARNLCRTLLQ